MDIGVSFGSWLKRRRKSLDLTQALLAEKVYCSLATIQKIESDERRPSRSLAELLANALEIPSEERALFLKVARGERPIDRLAEVPALVDGFSMFKRRHTLPVQSTTLLGREAELAELSQLLREADCRLLTIVGPGGMGKTRLAIAAAAANQDGFAHGACFVSLAPLNKPEFIVPAIAGALEVSLTGPADPQTQLRNYLADKELLLVLDNYEHLLSGAGVLVGILSSAPGVKLLATSRERLSLQVEWVVDLHGLVPPRAGDAAGIEQNSAVQLFVRSAQRIRHGFTITDENREAVAHICRLVDGMPLGIELAAAWTRTLSCREIAEEIERSLDFLSFSVRDRPERHQSLRAVFEHSWQLLGSQEQQVLPQLSVFRGGFERQAAEQVAGATLPILAALTDKSLLSRTEAGRYNVHELIRQYAAVKLSEAGEEAAALQRHFDYYQSLAEAAAPHLLSGEKEGWLDRLEAENDNLRAALGFSRDQAGSRLSMLRMAGALVWFWSFRGYLHEGRRWLESALSGEGASVNSVARLRSLHGAGRLAVEVGDHQAAKSFLEESVAGWRALASPDKRDLAYALVALGGITRDDGDLPRAHSLEAESIELFQEQGDRWGLAYALIHLAMVLRDEGAYEEAGRLCERSIRLWRELGDAWGLSYALHNDGLIALRQGNYEAARAREVESLPLTQQSGHKRRVSQVLLNVGLALLNLGEFTQALPYVQQASAIAYELGDKYGIANTVQYLGYLALLDGNDMEAQTLFDQGFPFARESGPKWICPLYLARYAGLAGVRGLRREAVQLWSAAEALMTARASYMDTADRTYYERTIAPSLVSLDETSIQAARAEGRVMSLEQAIQYAQQVLGAST